MRFSGRKLGHMSDLKIVARWQKSPAFTIAALSVWALGIGERRGKRG